VPGSAGYAIAMPLGFYWTTFDLNDRVPVDWQDDIRAAATDADFREFPRTPVISREAEHVARILRGRVHAAQEQISGLSRS